MPSNVRTKSKLKNKLIKIVFFIIKKLKLIKKNPLSPEKPKILIISTTAIGDSLWATPVIKEIKKTYSSSYLAVLTIHYGKEIFKNNPNIDELIEYKNSFFKIFSLIKNLKQKKFQMALLFHSSQRTILPILNLIGVNNISGTENLNKGLDFLLTDVQKNKNQHEIIRRYEIAKILNIKKNNSLMELILHQKEKSFFKKKKKPIIAIHPGATDNYKRWPKKYFIMLGNLINRNLDAEIVITGSNKEKNLVLEISNKIKTSRPLFDLNIRQFASFLNNIDLLITNDTGPMHMAIALNKKIIAIFGGTDPKICGPLNYSKAVIFYSKNNCCGCLKRKCENPVCLYKIKPKNVFQTIKEVF